MVAEGGVEVEVGAPDNPALALLEVGLEQPSDLPPPDRQNRLAANTEGIEGYSCQARKEWAELAASG